MIVSYWTDPDDCDYATNRGFVTHTLNQEYLDWLEELSRDRPNVAVSSYRATNRIFAEAVTTVTKYRLVD
jgi:hypothetical protein